MEHQAFAQLLGNYGEFLSSIAVFATLIYAAVQIRQSNKIALAEGERDLYFHWMHGLDSLVSDESTTDTFLRGLAEFESLTAVEKTRLSYKLIELNVVYASMLTQSKQGMVSQELTEQIGDVMFSYIMTPGGRRWWDANGPFQTNRDVINRRIETEGEDFPSILKTLPYHNIEDEHLRMR